MLHHFFIKRETKLQFLFKQSVTSKMVFFSTKTSSWDAKKARSLRQSLPQSAPIQVCCFFNDNATKAPILLSNTFFNFINITSGNASLRFFNATTSKQCIHCGCPHLHLDCGSVIRHLNIHVVARSLVRSMRANFLRADWTSFVTPRCSCPPHRWRPTNTASHFERTVLRLPSRLPLAIARPWVPFPRKTYAEPLGLTAPWKF